MQGSKKSEHAQKITHYNHVSVLTHRIHCNTKNIARVRSVYVRKAVFIILLNVGRYIITCQIIISELYCLLKLKILSMYGLFEIPTNNVYTKLL